MALVTKTLRGFQQGVDKRFRITWPEHPELILEPETDTAELVVRMLKSVDSNTLVRANSLVLSTLTSASNELTLFADHIDVLVPGEKSYLWKLDALNTPFDRTESQTGEVTVEFPLQLVYAELSVVDSAKLDRPVISGLRMEWEIETGVRYG